MVGLRYAPLNLESTAPGCLCEGWGVADAASGLTGSANEEIGNQNLTVDSFTAPTANQAISNVLISDPSIPGYAMRVVQDYHPSPLSPNLYVDTVTITNTGTNPLTDLRYRRVMDWDIEPTAFEEWVTNQGTSPQLLFSSDDGFAPSDPLAGPSYVDSEAVCGTAYTGACQFTDLGVRGHLSHDDQPRRPRGPVRLRPRRARAHRVALVQRLLRRRQRRGGGDPGAPGRRGAGLLARRVELRRHHGRDLLRHAGGRSGGRHRRASRRRSCSVS